jgi:iron complex outermembrane receptor protein
MTLKAGYTDEDTLNRVEGSSPRHQAMLWSSWDLPHRIYLDAQLFYVSELSYQTQEGPYEVPDYFNLNLRLAWQARKNLELSLVGQNLLKESHLEYISEIQQTKPTEIPRSVYFKMEVKF